MTPDSVPSPIPGYFGPEKALFGWLHRGDTIKTKRAPVVICGHVGYEQVRLYRTIRELAVTLSRQGHTVLRFDYPACGDSADLPDGADHVEAWLNSIHSAIEFAKSVTQSNEINLVGIRLGATLASVVAEKSRVSHLVMWEPAASGRSFCREMQIVASAAARQSPPNARQAGIEAGGFLITPATEERLKTIELGQKPLLGSPPILLLERDDMPVNEHRAKALLALDSPLDRQSVAGYRQMMLPPQESVVPSAAIERILTWLGDRAHSDTPTLQHGFEQEPDAVGLTPKTELGGDVTEEALTFGSNKRLFGVLTRSRRRGEKPGSGRPTIITLCGGTVPHYSATRMYVPLARRLAETGHNVLRIDLSGVGDSEAAPGTPPNLAYATTACSDIEAAMDAVHELTGATRFALFGLCSGAYAAMQAAKQSNRIVKLILVNQLVYHVSDLDFARLASGELRSGHALDFPRSDSFFDRAVRRALRSSRRSGAWLGKLVAKRLVGCNLSRELRHISKRGIGLDFVFSEGDAAIDALKLPARTTVRRLIRTRSASIKIIENSDHIFSPVQAQAELIDYVVKRLDERSQPY